MYKDALRSAAWLAEKSRKHPGCIAYDVFVSTTRADVFMICETWKDQASLDEHSATPEFKRYSKEMTDSGLLKINVLNSKVLQQCCVPVYAASD